MKEKVQVFGRALSAMVMPNIGAFIAWGFITALFIATGWIPNETFAELVNPIAYSLLPILIAYTAGSNVHGVRGGVIGGITVMGAIVASPDAPMFLGAMIVGPLSAYLLKKFDKAIEGKVKAGFEMLVNNFSLGIIGMLFAMGTMVGITPLITIANNAMQAGVNFFVERGLFPLAALFVEPAKILFLNNAINHGILSPMGIQDVAVAGKSIFFLLESNPGPGLGILLAYSLVGKGAAKASAPGAAIIHFFGGIHEIYFPYVLMNPFLLISAIVGGASGIFIFDMMGVGLTSAASPGSIIALLMMAERTTYIGLLLGVVVSTAVSFVISIPLLKFMGKDMDLQAAQAKKDAMKAQAKGTAVPATTAPTAGTIQKIAFACDAGMGSSAMGASVLRKKIANAGLKDITVIHTSVSSIPSEIQLVVTHENLQERAHSSNPNAELVLITNFMNAPQYDELVTRLTQQ